jgi:hypothetical protein
MGVVKLHELSIPQRELVKMREDRFLNLSPPEKLYALLNLIHVAVKLNNGKPLKSPQGKGIIIQKPL